MCILIALRLGLYKVMSVNKEIEDLSIELNRRVKETEEYKEYVKSKKELNSNSKLISIKKNLEKMKHVMCSCDDENIKNEYLNMLNIYESSPLVVNFKIYESRLNELMRELFNDINKGL